MKQQQQPQNVNDFKMSRLHHLYNTTSGTVPSTARNIFIHTRLGETKTQTSNQTCLKLLQTI